ncbi:endonuclease/exonuclease/phosphatase family protein [Deinococcus arenicola]|uniref:Endonuclease/exonuclease/phosphatase family protein n=1 Tax=Deinococcus arenicola TaxID=2994950 RepID=A0ABU4DUL6_9DEIO|nr:endonuclease/exonuclease/phosphatase family protein [Deinococcus sp. ZS9-10]MDV6376133.1 endonuclease/exonuclease/phosphatase family protein [Deinococcus sp. ZS9-10]
MFRSRLAWFYLLFVVLIWGLGVFVGERTLPTLLLAYAPAVLWLLPAPLVLLWTGIRKRGFAVALTGTLLAAWGAGFLHWTPQMDGELRVLDYNVNNGYRSTPERLAGVLEAADADIILLQESNFQPPGYPAALAAALPGYAVRSAAEVMTFTRLPVLSSETADLPGNQREVLLTRLQWRGEPLTVVNAHLGTVQVSAALTGDFAYLNRTRTNRAAQVQVLTEMASKTSGRLLLGGDLNTPPRGLIYRQLQQAFGADAFTQAGRGPGWTFPQLRVRIDHQMARGLMPTRAIVLDAEESDHLPLVVEYRAAKTK